VTLDMPEEQARAQEREQATDADFRAALAGRYLVERELGRGGMATVYLARDLRHRRPVAIKVLAPDLSQSLGAERFLREIEVAANLQHPHLVPLFDSGEAAGLLYYVMPYVEGESLRARLTREGQLAVEAAVALTREVAGALDYAHEHGVVHRDIKPENVLVSGGEALVADFGVARAVAHATAGDARGTLTETGLAVGTPAYMSPEQAVGERDVDARSDQYSLACVAYELLTGSAPFTGTSSEQVAQRFTTDPPKASAARAELPPAMDAVLARALALRPQDRYATAGEFARALGDAARSGSGRPRRSLGSWRTAVLGAASLTTIAVVGSVLRSGGASHAAPDRAKPPTVAVLPFENLGAAADEYFADGMTEELTGRLAKLSGLAVIARTSVIQYKRTTKPIPQIAKELGAEFLIEGTVRWEKTADGGGRVRVSPQVIRASDGTNVWADQFDEPYGTDIFAMQSAIADHVVSALDVKLRPGDERVMRQVPTTNLAAYDAYIRAQTFLDRDLGQNWEAERQAFESLEQAVRLDSGFTAAHALLAWVHLLMESDGYDPSLGTRILPEQRWEMARAAALRALALDSLSPLAHRVLSIYYEVAARDTARQRAELALSLRGEPSSPDAIRVRAFALADAGRTDDALRELERAASLDPRNPQSWAAIAGFYGRRRDLARSSAALERAIAVAPSEPDMYIWLAWERLMKGRRDDARATLHDGITHAGVSPLLYKTAQHTVWINMIRMLPEDLAEPARQATWAQFGADSTDYYQAKMLGYLADPPRSRAYYDSLVAWARPRARASTRDLSYPIVFAWALAGAGRRADAARELAPVLHEDSPGNVVMFYLGKVAEACLMTGNDDCAVAQIARAIADSPYYTPAIFRLDPMWDPLRKRADFKKLVEAQ
jgi:serine/threonine-protein kinase